MPLAKENANLKQQLKQLIETAHDNERKLKRFETIEYKLLSADNFTELLDILLVHYPSLFHVEFTSLILADLEMNFDSFFKPLLDNTNYSRVKLLHLPKDIEQLEHLSKKLYFSNYEHNKHHWLQCKDTQLLIKSIGILPLVRHGNLIGLFCCFSENESRFNSDFGTDFIKRLGNIISICLENILNHEQLTLITYTDPLTKTKNRRYFDQMLEQEVTRSNRNITSLSCVLLDIDHFKSVNDTYGHQAGDEILINIVKRIKSVLRNYEMLARFGGEEFVLILPQTANKAAINAASRIVEIIHDKEFIVNQSISLKVTISAGVSTFTSQDQILDRTLVQEQLVSLADKALYLAKDNGRDQVKSLGEIQV